MTTQTFVIPEPPSVNNLFRNVPGKGRVKTKRYSIWMRAAQWDVILDGNKPMQIETLTGPVEISIELGKSRGDIDNRIKGILDLLVYTHVIRDDSQVQFLVIARDGEVRKRAVVTVRPFVKITPWPTRSASC